MERYGVKFDGYYGIINNNNSVSKEYKSYGGKRAYTEYASSKDTIKEVVLTDYDTVKFPGLEEMTVEEFFEFFELGIKEFEITDCMYDLENDVFCFKYKGKMYNLKIKNKISKNATVMHVLVKLEEDLRIKKEAEDKRKEVEQQLLKDARNGCVNTEEAKQLYMNELREKLSFKTFLKKLKERSSDNASLSPESSGLLGAISVFTTIVSGALIGVNLALLNTFKFSYLILLLFSLVSSACSICRVNIFIYGFRMIKSIFELISDNKIIRHKLKYLRNYSLPKERNVIEDLICSDPFDEYIREHLHIIYGKLSKLSDEKNASMRKKLVEKLKKFEQDLENVPKEGLTLVTASGIKGKFLNYLDSFEKEIDRVIEEEKSLPLGEYIDIFGERTKEARQADDVSASQFSERKSEITCSDYVPKIRTEKEILPCEGTTTDESHVGKRLARSTTGESHVSKRLVKKLY